MSDPTFVENAEHLPDELIAGGPIRTRSVNLTENQAQGALTRGAVLGEVAGNYARVHQTGSYVATTAKAILAKDADPSGGDVTALVYVEADVNEDEVNLGGTITLANVREPLQENSIHLKTPVSR